MWAAGVTPSSLARALAERGRRRARPRRAADRRGRPLASAATPRCWRSATWSRSAAATARRDAAGAGAGRDAAGPLRRRRGRWRGSAAAARRRSATTTRATSRRSAARARSPTSRASTSAARSAWFTWLAVHLFYLIGFQNRLIVLHALGVQLPHARPRRATDRGHRGGAAGRRAPRPARPRGRVAGARRAGSDARRPAGAGTAAA